MGRHSSNSGLAFYRSVVAWFLPWIIVAFVVAVGIWLAVDALGNDDIETPEVAGATREPSRTPDREPASPSPSPSPQPSKSPKPEPSTSPAEEVALITENMTVQVLNGNGDPSADDRMASQLSELGFEVVAVQGSSEEYPSTTVFWSYTESQEAAERLAQRFGWQVAPKPSNLSTTVALHVVVGLDYQ
ncbi:MAG: LytR C-terminal domain-containing protein [Actinomycetota bacterium]